MTALHPERAELVATLFALQQAFEALIVRGLESSAADDTRRLAALGDELARAGAAYLAAQVAALVHAIGARDADAARALLRAQTAMRVLERVLSLDAAAEALASPSESAAGRVPQAAPPVTAALAVTASAAASAAASASKGPATTAVAARPDLALVPILDEVAGLIEGLVASGLTAASAATQQKLDASFREVSRLKLLRLAAVLRYVGDECGRFVAESPQFSARRLAFFLHRTWLLCRGLARAMTQPDPAALARLTLQVAPTPVAQLIVAVLGVQKRALLDGSAAFDFHLQALDGGEVARGTRLVWSCVFGARAGVPAEAFLHLPQPQEFLPKLLLEPTQIVITRAAVGAGRLTLGPKSTVTPGARITDGPALPAWDPARATARIRDHAISPLDLEVELQEHVILTDYELAPAADHPFRTEQQIVAIRAGDLALDAVVSRGPDGVELAAALDQLRKPRAKRPPLYGLLHYEMARLVFQPLTAFAEDGPRHLMISSANIDLASLMKTLDFTT